MLPEPGRASPAISEKVKTMTWILERAKAFVAVLAAGIAPVLIQATETATGFDIPATWELAFVAFVTGLVVHQVPNKTPAA